MNPDSPIISPSEDPHRYRLLFLESADPQFVADPGGQLIEVNPAMARLLAEPAEAIAGRSFLEMIVDSEARRRFRALLTEEGIVRDQEVGLQRPDGTILRGLVTAVGVPAEAGQPPLLLGALRDVSLQRQVNSLIASLARFPAENPSPILRISRGGIMIYANPAARSLTDAWNCEVGRRVPRNVFEGVRDMEDSSTRRFDIPTGPRIWSCFAAAIAGEDYINIYLADVTEQRQSESLARGQAEALARANGELAAANENLRGEAARLEVILRALGEGVIVIDRQHRVLLANAAARALIGDSTSGTGQILYSLLPDCHPTHGEIRHRLDALPAGRVDTFTITCTRPALRSLHVTVSAWAHPGDEAAGRVLVLRDVTRERELERMKDDFVRSVSHELRTPLTSIMGFTAALRDDPELAEPVRRRFVEILDREATRLARLIEDLLETSRLLGQPAPFVRRPVDLAGLVRRTAETFHPALEEQGLDLELDLPEGVPPVLGDEQALSRVLVNLLGNAVKFTPAGSIALALAPDPAGVRLTLTDTGLGIPAEELPLIFERFHRVPRPETEIPGMGLGLAIVHEIVHAHEGRIEVASQPGRGTAFSIILPRSP